MMDTQSKVFPITDREADVLHDLGWNSGFGWKDEWDWWRSDSEVPAEDDAIRLRLVNHLMSIRSSVAAAEEVAKRILRTA